MSDDDTPIVSRLIARLERAEAQRDEANAALVALVARDAEAYERGRADERKAVVLNGEVDS